MNVVSLERYKVNADLKKSQGQYGQYLSGLNHAQLESEINYLLNSEDAAENDSLLKGQMILKEIAGRTDGDWSVKINEMNQNLSRKIETLM